MKLTPPHVKTPAFCRASTTPRPLPPPWACRRCAMSQCELMPMPAPSVVLHDGHPATTSLEIAKFFRKRYTDVLRDI